MGRLGPYSAGKGCIHPSYPNGDSSGLKVNLMPCRLSHEAARLNIQQRWKWFGCSERMSGLRARLEQAELIINVQKKLSQLLGLPPDETETDDNK